MIRSVSFEEAESLVTYDVPVSIYDIFGFNLVHNNQLYIFKLIKKCSLTCQGSIKFRSNLGKANLERSPLGRRKPLVYKFLA